MKHHITVYSMSKILNIPRTTIRDRIYKLGIRGKVNPDDKMNIKTIYYTRGSFEEIKKSFLNYNSKSPEIKKEYIHIYDEIVYVTRTTEIIHSKLNFLTLEQL